VNCAIITAMYENYSIHFNAGLSCIDYVDIVMQS